MHENNLIPIVSRRLVGSGDAYPSKWGLKVEKGEYTLRAHIRQEKRDLLDRLDSYLVRDTRVVQKE